ncbi:MAG: Protein TolB [Planctomycetes bacterium]|nr:Protein TolB [Planctomycetota bacterium]
MPTRDHALLSWLLAAAGAGALAAAASAETFLVSANLDGDTPGTISGGPSITANGKLVAFVSYARDLVPGGSSDELNVFIRDVKKSTTRLVSVAADGTAANAECSRPSVSATGRYVVFQSTATSFPGGATNGRSHIYRKDLKSGALTRVTRSVSGGDADGDSYAPSVSSNGRYVAFWSHATDLVPGDDGGHFDCFVTDLKTGTTTRVSTDAGGAPGNAGSSDPRISANGRWVAFHSSASNLVPGDENARADVFVVDLKSGEVDLVSRRPDGSQTDAGSVEATISANGRYVSFGSVDDGLVEDDTNERSDVFLLDRKSGTIVRASVGPDGQQGDEDALGHSISPDGKFVAFSTVATNFADDQNDTEDVFIYYAKWDEAYLVSTPGDDETGNGPTRGPSVSKGGIWIAVESEASNLIPGGGDGWPEVLVIVD